MLKVIFQGLEGLNLPLLSNSDTYRPFIQNLFQHFLYYGMQPPQDGDNEL